MVRLPWLARDLPAPRRNGFEVHSVKDTSRLSGAQQELRLGMGEVSVILLAIELDADALLMDDRAGRRAAWKKGVDTIGCVGVLEVSEAADR
jgi:predicted nucleic acid-binding protein